MHRPVPNADACSMSATDQRPTIDTEPHFAWHFREQGRHIECLLSEAAFDSWLQRGDHRADMARLRRYARAIAVAHVARQAAAIADSAWVVHIARDSVHCAPATT
jgi:hypothetical protein